MKTILQFILVFNSIFSFGQTFKTTTVYISTGDCRINENSHYLSPITIELYKLPEDTLLYLFSPKKEKTLPIKLENISISEYKLVYKNNFDILMYKLVTLNDDTVNHLKLCPDELQDYPQNTLSKLQDKDTISIFYHSKGCFHNTLLKILITKEADKFIAKIYEVVPHYFIKRKVETINYKIGTLLQTVTLTYKNIQDFKRFENELNYVKCDYGGTTTDWYEIESKYLNKNMTDGGMKWKGFYYLKKSFFGEKK